VFDNLRRLDIHFQKHVSAFVNVVKSKLAVFFGVSFLASSCFRRTQNHKDEMLMMDGNRGLKDKE
jgi:hypothetical protein